MAMDTRMAKGTSRRAIRPRLRILSWAAQGNDLLQVSHGDNLLIAGSGHDTITGGDGQDTIFGGGHDTINLNYGNEFVQGGSGSDAVHIGLHGNDVIYGGAATTVHTDQTSSSIKSEVEVHGVTTITFSNHQSLTASNVTIEFADGHRRPSTKA